MTMLPRFARILVVDDSAVTRKAVRAMLEYIMRRYALVISNWFMEPMRGIKLLTKLRRTERGRRLPFIMMTAQNQQRFMEVARDTGATHFLAKPFTAETLRSKIETIDFADDD